MTTVSFGKTIPAFVAALLLLSAAPACLAATQDKFSDGSAGATISFPEKGGSDMSVSVDLPRHITVNSAFLDVEGRGRSYSAASGFYDYAKPGGSTAFSGTTASLPPAGKPAGFESTNITSDAALQSSDSRRSPAKAPNSVPYHLFEFDLTEVAPDNFDFMWEGIGTIYPNSGNTYSTAEVYLYNGATASWVQTDSYTLADQARDDTLLWAHVGSGASGYPDGRGMLCLMVTVPLPAVVQYTGYLETDYAALWFNGTRVLYPENLKLDLKGDGSVEWARPGRLRGNANFTGNLFTSALQAILDAAPTPTVNIPLKFSSDKGGILFVSNLSIDYDLRNFPPETNGTVPLITMYEDTNVTGLLDLRDWFKDDAGAGALVFDIVFEQDTTKLDAVLNADGHRVDFFLKTPNWYGELRFRARATDAEGLSAEADFRLAVQSVNDPPRLKGAGTLAAYQGVLFEYTFSATDVDYGVDPAEALEFCTNSTYLSLQSDTGLAFFTPVNSQVGTHLFNVTVTDHYGASDKRNFTLRIDNRNDPPSIEEVPDQTAVEDQPFLLRINASDPDLAIGQDALAFEDNSTLFAISANGTCAFTPANRDVGDHRISVWVTDLAGLRAFANFTITVQNVNDPPRLQPVEDLVAEEDKNVSFKIFASDEDAGDTLSFSDNSSMFSINSTGWIGFSPAQKDVGVHAVSVTVTDAAGASATVFFNITVLNLNDPPREVRIVSPGNGTAFRQGEEIAFTGNAADDDGDQLNFSWYSGDRLIGTGPSLKKKDLKSGTHIITLKVSDGSGSVASGPVEITVKKKASSPAKGFVPGFGLVPVFLALAALGLVARRRK